MNVPLRVVVRADGVDALERSHCTRPGSFGSTVPVTTAEPSLRLLTLIRTFVRAVTVSSLEPMPSAAARSRVVSPIAILAEKDPSAALVTVVVASVAASRAIVTVTPARAA